MSAEVIEWLRSPAGLEWSMSRRPSLSFADADVHLGGIQGPGNCDEDPCGRPPVTGKGAARKTGAALWG